MQVLAQLRNEASPFGNKVLALIDQEPDVALGSIRLCWGVVRARGSPVLIDSIAQGLLTYRLRLCRDWLGLGEPGSRP
ncbi:MAG TPA: hypothetical protein VFQ77_15525 [Pseudonocardiaceae bacterium]|jgi:hypothetical protein|nr:hypothetical protein [Pseudonocardiaceae bacterium]